MTRLANVWLRWLFAINGTRITSIQRFALCLSLACTLFAFMVSLRDAETYAGLDLRGKVTGARALVAGLDPFFYEWHPGDGEWLLDPPRDHPGPTRCTYSPTVLMLYATFCGMPYSTQRHLWVWLEWVALLLCVLLAARLTPSRQRANVVLVCLLGFACAPFWRLHVERGQYYVFVLLAVMYSCYLTLRVRARASWWPLGIAIALRPTWFFATALGFGFGRRRWAMGAMLVAGVVSLLPLLFYANTYGSMAQFARWRMAGSILPAGAYTVPTVAEGRDFAKHLEAPSTMFTFVTAAVRWTGMRMRDVGFLQQVGTAVGAVFAALMLGLAWLNRKRRHSRRFVLFVGAICTLAIEYCLIERSPYADVVLLAPLVLAWPMLTAHIERWPGLILWSALAGLVFAHHFVWGIQPTVAVHVEVTLLVGGLLLFAVCRQALK